MLGHVLFKKLSTKQGLEVFGTIRTASPPSGVFTVAEETRIRPAVDADNFDTIIRAFAAIQPHLVINCVGLIKQLPSSADPLSAVTINSQLPHRISLVCRTAGARLIHISTDCVFNGTKGNYSEADPSDALDLYGRTKFLGEVSYPPHCLTLRTSIIGHEIKNYLSLVEWFLGQSNPVNGYCQAFFSGLTTLEMTQVLTDHVIPNPALTGLFHVSTSPISKHDLLQLIKHEYSAKAPIVPDNSVRVDRTLDSSAFRSATGYHPPTWPDLIRNMHQDFQSASYYKKTGNRQ